MSELILFNSNEYKTFKEDMIGQGKVLLPASKAFNFSTNSINEILDEYSVDQILIDLRSFKEVNNVLFLERIVNNELQGYSFFGDFVESNLINQLEIIFSKLEYYNGQQEKKEVNPDNHIKKITDLNRKEIESMSVSFSEKLLGHDKFKDLLSEKLLEYKILNSIDENSIFSVFLMGMSGVGKTEVARIIHKLLGGSKRLAKINFGNYGSNESLNSLIGSPRGYIGSETGELFDKIEVSDTGILLLDEFEKADSKIYNYFLEVLETGYATNSQGNSVNLNGYIFVFTSNVSTDRYETIFSPELRSRFNLVSFFNPLSYKDKQLYTYNRTKKYIESFNLVHNKRLDKRSIQKIVNSINVENHENIRLLNSLITKKFIDYIKTVYAPDDDLWKT